MKLPTPVEHFLSRFPNQHVAFASCAIFIIGLLAGRAIMSIAMIWLFGNAIFNKQFLQIIKTTLADKTSLLFMGLFLLYALSGLWSANNAHYLQQLQLMLPFLVMPVAFHAIQWPKRNFEFLLQLFILIGVIGSCWSIAMYLQDKETIDAAYNISKSMPTPFQGDHIRYAVAVVVAISFCFHFLKTSGSYRWLYILAALFLIVYLHLLASKTALLAFYIISIFEIVKLVKEKQNRYWAFGLFVVLILLPILFYYSSPSFRNKINYTVYSYNELFNEQAQTNISDEGRVVSYKTAWGEFKKNIFIGVGLGDGPDVMKEAYAMNGINTQKVLNPHNQFLYIALILGLLGLFYFIFFVAYLFWRHFATSALLASFLLIFVVPFMVEAFFNTQYGIALFVFFFFLLKRSCNPLVSTT